MIYKCNQCGAALTYSPEKKAMHCEHCDGINTEVCSPDNSATTCSNCGAPISPKQYTSALMCEHCGCHLILDEKISGQYQPHLILPFNIGKNTAKKLISDHLKTNIFVPDEFLKDSNLDSICGEYVPFWLYDFDANYNYEAKGTKVRRWITGDTEYTETSVFAIYRNMDIDYNLIPADASIELDDNKMDLIEPYDYSALEKFQAKYMSGFYSEVYNFFANDLEPRARAKTVEYSKQLMNETVTGYTSVTPSVQDLRINTVAENFALLPVWIYKYTYKNQLYEFFVNGQTGKIVGRAPTSKLKALAYSAFLFVCINVILFLVFAILEVF